MIQEAYCSFEVSKLLKEKGFNEPTIGTYYKDGTFNYLCLNTWNSKFITPISAPTLQMAMAWLREEHRLFVNIEPLSGIKYTWSIWFMNESKESESSLVYDTYEKACEAAINYCIENLI